MVDLFAVSGPRRAGRAVVRRDGVGGKYWEGAAPKGRKHVYEAAVPEVEHEGVTWCVHLRATDTHPEWRTLKLRAKGFAKNKANYWLEWNIASGQFRKNPASKVLFGYRPSLARCVAQVLAKRFGVDPDAADAGWAQCVLPDDAREQMLSEAADKARRALEREAEKAEAAKRAKARQTRKEWLAGMEERKAARLEREAAKRAEDLKRMNTDPRHRKKGFRLLSRSRAGASV